MADDPTAPDGASDATDEGADDPDDGPTPDADPAGEPAADSLDGDGEPGSVGRGVDGRDGEGPAGEAGVDGEPPGADGAPDRDEASASDEADEASGGDGAVPADADGSVAGDSPGDRDVPDDGDASDDPPARADTPPDVRKYERFKKVDGAQYERVNDFLRERTYVTAREWAIARLCADFRTETGVEMTKIGENLPELVPFMEDTYTPQAVNQARSSFEEKVHKAGATFLYGAMCDFFTAEELDELMYEVTEVAKFLLEVEGIDLTVEEELEAEDRISGVMREVREASEALRYEECPHCGEQLRE